MTTVAIVSALEERLRSLFPEANPKSGLTARINNKLLPILKHLKQSIEDPHANRSDELTLTCLREVRTILYNLEDLVEWYFLEEASRRNGFLKRTFSRPIQPKVIEILQEKLAVIITDFLKHPDTARSQYQCPAERQIPSPAASVAETEDAEKELELALTRGSLQLTFVSICGMGGIGKTTLAKQLLNNPRIRSHFEIAVWTSVSPAYDTRAILRNILSCISPEPIFTSPWTAEDELAEQIYRSLKGRRYLIVLDDVWSSDAWFSIRIAFPSDSNGSRILITTRNEDVALQVGGPNTHIHMMRTLTEKQSLDLFRREAGLQGGESNPEIEQTALELARRTGGLPLAINLLARALFRRTTDERRQMIEHLDVITTSNRTDTLDILDLSYNDLPHRLRPCLLYLANFPEDSDIEMDTVFQMWIAEGLISTQDKRNGETIMNIAERYLQELVNRNLVQILAEDVSGQRMSRRCRIHDLIRELCKKKGKDEEFLEDTDTGDKNQTMNSACRRAIYLDKHECTDFHLYGNANYLRSLLFFNSSQSEKGHMRPREIPNLNRFIWLRTLHLCGVDFKHGKPPKGIGKLAYLRYLSFRDCYLEELNSQVSNMFYLQTLDLRVRKECKMTIPDSLDNLKRLKYLYLPLAYQTLDHKMLHLGSLKELEIVENFDTSLCSSKDLLELTNLTELAIATEGDISEIERILNFVESNLRSTSLKIRNFDCYSAKRSIVIEKVFNSRALHALGVEGYLGKLPEVDKICPKLTKIVLSGSELGEDPMQVLKELPNLRILVLEIEACIGKEMKCSSSGFPELRYLKLYKLYNLEEWEVEAAAMPKLSILVIENCKKFKMLPAGLRFLPSLQKLKIASMLDEFVGRIRGSDVTEGADFDKIRHVPNVKIDGQSLFRKERQQGPGGDPRSSSMF